MLWTALLLAVYHSATSAAPISDDDYFSVLGKFGYQVDLAQFLNTSYIWTTVIGTQDRDDYVMEPQESCLVDEVECVSENNVILTSNLTLSDSRLSGRFFGVFLTSTAAKPTSMLIMHPASEQELCLEKLVYSSEDNSCGIFFVINFLSSSLWKKINQTAKFPDISTLEKSTTYLAEVWPKINKTLKSPDEMGIMYTDEEIMNYQCHIRVRGNSTQPYTTTECNNMYKTICNLTLFTPFSVYDKTCPNEPCIEELEL